MKKIIILTVSLLLGFSALAWVPQPKNEKITLTQDGTGPIFLVSRTYSGDYFGKVKTTNEFINRDYIFSLNYEGQAYDVMGPRLLHWEKQGEDILFIYTLEIAKPTPAEEEVEITENKQKTSTGIIALCLAVVVVIVLTGFRKK